MASSGDDTKIVGDTGRRKPPRAGMGRPPGAQNKITKTVKQAIEAAFENVGGTEWLIRLAQEDPRTFAILLAKLVPSDVRVEQKPTFVLVNAVDPDSYS